MKTLNFIKQVLVFVVLICGFILAVLITGAQAQSPFMFVSWADTKSAKADLSELSDQAVLLDPAFTIYPGDLESSGFTPGGMDEWKEAMNGQLTPEMDTSSNGMFDIAFPVRGNHDDSNTSGWQAYFDFQATADLVGATNYTNRPEEEDLTYSFDYENAHFIGVDVTGSAPKITSAQVQWIDDDLTAAEARGLTHAFIYFHGPIYCVDGHCSCSQRTCSIDTDVENLIVVINQHPIVSATFHGHEHTYAYTYIDETRIPPEGSFEGVTHPFHQFVTGSAGAGPTSCDPPLRCDYNMADKHGFVTVDVDGPNVTVTFYQQGSMDPVNTISFTNEGGVTPTPPTANDDSASTPENTPVTINVAANDTDPNGDLNPLSANTTCTGCADPGNGSLVNNGDGTFDYTPNNSFTGSDSFVYEICDEGGLCDTGTVSITVTPPNDPPVANDDSATTAEDTPVTIDVAANDSDLDGNLDLTTVNTACAGCADPDNGSLVNHADGSFTYSPNADFNGSDSFNYQICDTYGLCDIAMVSITVDPVADPPTANDDSATTAEDTPVTINVAANDTDPDGNLDPASTNTDCPTCAYPAKGNLANNGDGTFDYTPDTGFAGTDSFVYEICDTDLACDTATVTITVNPPAVIVDAVSSGTTAGSSLTISHTTSGSDRLMLVGVSINNDNLETVSSITYNGASLSQVGFVDHQGSGGDDSRVEIWKLVAPSSGTYDVVITFSADLRHYAVAGVTTFTGVDQTHPLGDFAANYGDSSSPSLSVPSASCELVLGVFACETCTSVSFSSPGVERWNLVAGGGNTIGAGASAEGASPEMTLSASLGKGDHWAMSGISIRSSGAPTPTNDPPVANDDSATTAEDTPITINVAANDTDPDGNLDPASTNTTCATCSEPDNGLLDNNLDGTLTYTPDTGFTGSDSFVYEICDEELACDTATVSITVNPPGPITFDVRVSASSDDAEERSSGSMYLTSSDLELVYDKSDQQVGMRFNGVDIPQGATIVEAYIQFQVDETNDVATSLTIEGEDIDNAATFVNTSGNISSRARTTAPVSWTPVPWTTVGQAGPDQQTPNIAWIVQEIVDRPGWLSGNSLVIIITGTGERTAEAYDGVQNAAPLLHVEYVTEPANQAPTATIIQPVDGATFTQGELISFSGSAMDDEDGNLSPSLAWDSSLDGPIGTGGSFSRSDLSLGLHTITATVTDLGGMTDMDQITMTVNAVNKIPVANADSATTDEDTAVTIDVLANDTDADADTLTVSSTTQGANGSVVVNGDNTVTYTPNADYNGTDTFSYTASDGTIQSDPATVTVTISAVNDAPVADPQSVTTAEDTSVTITLTASDVDGDSLTYSMVSDPTNGSLSGTAPNLTYQPNAGYNGSDSCTFKVNDGTVDSNVATVSITVTAVNNIPVASADAFTVTEDSSDNLLDVLANDTDADSDPLTIALVGVPDQGGTVTINATSDGLIYSPAADFAGTENFTYTASDGQAESSPATVAVTVTNVNDAPVADPQSVTTAEDTSVTITLTASDVDGDSLTYRMVSDPTNGSLSGTAPNLTYQPNAGYNGTDTFTYKANDGALDSNIATVSITVIPTEIHIGDMDGSSLPSGKKKWKATVSLTVHDANEVIVENAEVFGTWSGGVSGSGSCITGIEGQCSLTSRPIANLEQEDVTFTVDNVTHATMSYDAGANHDEDGDSDGTVIIVYGP